MDFTLSVEHTLQFLVDMHRNVARDIHQKDCSMMQDLETFGMSKEDDYYDALLAIPGVGHKTVEKLVAIFDSLT